VLDAVRVELVPHMKWCMTSWDLPSNGPGRISSNILAGRLTALVENGLLARSDDPTHKQKVMYSLTEQAIQLVPVFVQLTAWGVEHLPVADEYAARMEAAYQAMLTGPLSGRT
jgi:DNA-binding HxlR family transcriptional regulator